MLDGRLNNEPPVRPDLTDGQTDEEIRELVPEAKPSLMDRLKADKPEHEARQMILRCRKGNADGWGKI